METFSTFLGLEPAHLVFSASGQLSTTLQAKNTSTYEAFQAAKITEEYYERQRSESAFDAFYDQVLKENEGKIQPPVRPRHRKPPLRCDEGSDAQRFDSPKAYFHQQCHEVFDRRKEELKRGFQQKNFCKRRNAC